MKAFAKILLVFIILFISGCISQEREISLSEFKAKLSNEKNVAVVTDITNAKNSGSVIQCGAVNLVITLTSLGKEVSYFSYDKDTCFYDEGSLTNRTHINTSTSICNNLISNKLTFYVKYNTTTNKTSLFERRAIIEGDKGFLVDCAIARMVK